MSATQPNDRIQRTMKALSANNIEAFFAADHDELCSLIARLVPEGSSVSFGGSMTLREAGVGDFIRSHDYRFLDREAPGADVQLLYRETFSADAYITSANAVSLQGDLFWVDGIGNRVAAVAFGPKRVVVVMGENKIAEDEEAAWERIRAVAAPRNSKRLGRTTGCTATGHCTDCRSMERLCCHYLRCSFQREGFTDRIKVILLPETLGY